MGRESGRIAGEKAEEKGEFAFRADLFELLLFA